MGNSTTHTTQRFPLHAEHREVVYHPQNPDIFIPNALDLMIHFLDGFFFSLKIFTSHHTADLHHELSLERNKKNQKVSVY